MVTRRSHGWSQSHGVRCEEKGSITSMEGGGWEPMGGEVGIGRTNFVDLVIKRTSRSDQSDLSEPPVNERWYLTIFIHPADPQAHQTTPRPFCPA